MNYETLQILRFFNSIKERPPTGEEAARLLFEANALIAEFDVKRDERIKDILEEIITYASRHGYQAAGLQIELEQIKKHPRVLTPRM